MNFIWKKEYETGIEKIDSQHKKLFELINKFYDDVIIKKNVSSVQETIVDMKLYTIFHFTAEEKLFKKYGYNNSEYHEHMEEHDAFRKKIAEFMADTTSSQFEIGYRITEFLKNWLLSHIVGTDMKFASYLKKNHFTEISLDKDITY